jgi:hypothetical protein
MKKLSFLLLILLSVNVLNAQVKKKTTIGTKAIKPSKPVPRSQLPKPSVFSVMDKNFLDPGIGLGTYYKGLPFGVSFEHGFTDRISAGAFLNYSSYSDNSLYNYNLHLLYAGLRGSYHLAELLNVSNPAFDPYAGISLGYYSASYSYAGDPLPGAYGSTVFLGVHAGARYMFSDNIGGFAEVGYGVAAVQIGASFKF